MRAEISTLGQLTPGDVVVENEDGRPVVVERPVPEIPMGATGTATVRGYRGMRVMRTSGTGGADGFWVTPNIVGGRRLHTADEVTDFQPDPDFAAAVDAYARHVHRIRAGVAQNIDVHPIMRSLLAVVDDGPVKP